MFINIRHNSKNFFVNNFGVPEIQTLKFLTQKKTIAMQISAASPSPNFHSWKSYVKKISVYFLAICANSPCQIDKFELKVVGVCILGT